MNKLASSATVFTDLRENSVASCTTRDFLNAICQADGSCASFRTVSVLPAFIYRSDDGASLGHGGVLRDP